MKDKIIDKINRMNPLLVITIFLAAILAISFLLGTLVAIIVTKVFKITPTLQQIEYGVLGIIFFNIISNFVFKEKKVKDLKREIEELKAQLSQKENSK